MNDYVIYSYFNGEQIQAVLNAIVMLVGSGGVGGDYLGLVKTAGVIGLFVAIIYGFVRARAEDAGMYLVTMAIFYSVLLIPRVEVTIEEAATGPLAGSVRTVANVPLGLALFGSMSSRIGHWLTDRTETFFSYPDSSLRFSEHGLMGGSRALREANTASIPDPQVRQDMVNFMRECINPEILANPAVLTNLISSTSIWSDFMALGLVNPGRVVTLTGGVGLVNCGQAHTQLGTALNAQAGAEVSRISRLLNPGLTPAQANASFQAMLPIAESQIMTASATAADAIRQRMMINMLNDTGGTLAQIMNDPSAAQNAMSAAMATASANSSYYALGKMASEALPMVRNAIELVVYAVFPIVFILIIIAGSKGGAVLKSYVMTMLWVQLWAPLYAIVHFVAQSSGNKSLSAALAGIDGISVANAAAFVNTSLSSEAIAGMLTISVPMIALALVKGGEVAMSGVVSSTMGPASQSAAKAGADVGTGNISAGNVQWGNYSASNTTTHQSTMTPTISSPSALRRQGAWATEVMDAKGNVAGFTPTGFGGGAATFGSGQTRANTNFSGAGVTGIASSNASIANSTTSGTTQTLSANTANVIGRALANTFGGGVDMASNLTAVIAGKFQSAVNGKHSNANSTTWTAGANGNAGIGLGGTPSDDYLPEANKVGTTGATTPQSGMASPANAAPLGAQPGQGGLPAPAGQPIGANGNAATQKTKAPQDGSPAAQLANYLKSRIPSLGVNLSVGGNKTQRAGSEMGHASEGSSTQGLEDGYRRALTAMDKAIATMSESGQREAARAFRNDFARQAQAVITTGHTLQETQQAGDQRTDARSNEVTVNASSGMPIYQAMTAMLRTTDPERIGQAMSDPAMIQAAQAYANSKLQAEQGTTHLSSGGLEAPKSKDQVRSEEKDKNAAKAADALSEVGKAQEENEKKARGEMHAPPTKSPDLSPASERAAEIMGSVAEGLGSVERQANFNKGALLAAEHVYAKLTSPDFDSFMGGALNSGARPTADQARQVVANLSASSPAFREALIKSGEDGQLSSGAKSYVEVKALEEWKRMTAPATWREQAQIWLNDQDQRNPIGYR